MKQVGLVVLTLACSTLAAFASEHYKVLEVVTVSGKLVPLPASLEDRLKQEADADDIFFPDPNNRFFARTIDLNNDGKPELQVACNTGSSTWPMWIFSLQNGKYVQLLKGRVGMLGCNVLEHISNGYHDISTVEPCSAVERSVTVYKFNGQKYVISETFSQFPQH